MLTIDFYLLNVFLQARGLLDKKARQLKSGDYGINYILGINFVNQHNSALFFLLDGFANLYSTMLI